MMRLRGHAAGEWTLLTLVLILLTGVAAWQGWLWRADQMLYDAGVSLGARTVPDDIVIVAIDEESLRRIGRWPWSRTIHATLVNKLASAEPRAIGLDIILSEPDSASPASDALLANEIRKCGRVVLPVLPRSLVPGLLTEGRPTRLIGDSAAGLGHIEIQLDADGIARSIYLWGGLAEPLHPQLALALQKVSRDGTALSMPARSIIADPAADDGEWHRDGWIHPQFAGPPGTFKTVSYVDVLTGAVPADLFRDKYVLVGATATGLGDQYATPMSALGIPMSGVEIHANVLDALRTGIAIDWLPPAIHVIVSAALVAVLMTGLLTLSPRNGLLASAFMVLLTVVGSLILLRWAHVWLPPSAALLGTVLAYPLWSWRRLETAQRFVDSELQILHESGADLADDDSRSGPFDKLENHIGIIRAATERQRAARKVRDDTIRFISHDIRSPLATIVTLVEGAGTQADDRLRHAGQYAQSALDLADDFFRLAKAEAIDVRKFTEMDLTAIVQNAVDGAWPIAEKKCISLQYACPDDEFWIRGDPVQLGRAFTNLLDNSIKFSPPESVVAISIARSETGYSIGFSDQGRGIAPEDQDRLFTAYGRLGEVDQPGVGLGLVIVKTIVERHGGHVTVDSRVGAGSRFVVHLPGTENSAG